jgi:hypothetical protein
MSTELEAEVKHLRAEVVRLDNKLLAVEARQAITDQVSHDMRTFLRDQWPETCAEIGAQTADIATIKTEVASIDGKLDEQDKRTWKLYVAVAALAAGGSSVGTIISSLLGG